MIDQIFRWAALRRDNYGPDTSRAPAKIVLDQELLTEMVKDISATIKASIVEPR